MSNQTLVEQLRRVVAEAERRWNGETERIRADLSLADARVILAALTAAGQTPATPESSSSPVASRTLVSRDYWSGTHRPYQGVLHGPDDVNIDTFWLLRNLLRDAGAQSGDEVEITMRRTGRRPFGDQRWILLEPHTYGPEPSPVASLRGAQEGTAEEGAPQSLDIEAMRANLHATFNGGHQEPETIKAFHHGMDTVCNVLAAHQKGERSNGILPRKEAPQEPPRQLECKACGGTKRIRLSNATVGTDLVVDCPTCVGW